MREETRTEERQRERLSGAARRQTPDEERRALRRARRTGSVRPSDAGVPTRPRGRVLIVEDDHDLGDIYADVLRSEGWEVVVARDGLEALEILENGLRPCVTIADLRMPRMDGWELVNRMRASESLGDVPLVLVAAHFRIAEEARQLGVKWWLQKPVSIDRLVSVISEACRTPAKERAL